MKSNNLLTIIFLLVGQLLIFNVTNAQVMEIGICGGLSYYIGDINPEKHFLQNELGVGFQVRYYQNSRWAFRFQYTDLNVKSSDEVTDYRPERKLNFKTEINDFSLMVEFNFFDYWTGSQRNFISPYLFAGISVFHFNPKSFDGTELHKLKTEGVDYSLWSYSVPFGIGAKYSIGKRIGLTLEWRIHKTFTDYIDDVHGTYPEKPAILNGINYSDPTDNYEPGMQRGDNLNKPFGDWFSFLSLSVSYRFTLPKNKKCNVGSEKKFYKYY